LPDLGAGGGPLLVALPDELIAIAAAELERDLTPEGERPHAAVIDTVGGIEVTAHHAGDLPDRLARHEVGGHHGGEGSDDGGVWADVVEGDEVVGLAASKARLDADYRGVVGLDAGEPAHALGEQAAEAARRVGVPEKRGRIAVDRVRIATKHAGER